MTGNSVNDNFESLPGGVPPKHKLMHNLIEQIAPLRVDVVLEGETGTGKDTLARKIHRLSGRRGNFVSLNCGAIPEHLAESELFGVMLGAYTGAAKSRAGYIEASNKGTLYLDEIDSMSLSLQAKFLKVLEVRGVERLGSTQFTSLDLRVVAATQTPLAEMVESGRFRRDLYYRLSVVNLKLPPLRSTPECILPLFYNFIADAAKRHGRPVKAFDTHMLRELIGHRWLGNIRELKYAAERYVLDMPVLNTSMDAAGGVQTRSLKAYLRELERILIQESLSRNLKSIDLVIDELEIPKRTLYHRMRRLNIVLDEI
ncbi:sigma 54-interacting transcriptional regulator [Pseudomonas fluorescens]|uniref:sigma 54-interacting transcriptional regulator n=1 Tax=Pseudomonas fluorescens TaxID=294 RepID=UPI001BE80A9A|nr:sigma 54-interacting transcriptional regulator [Pseudomonas fluorescens]MBT2375476.1 sigma-54-dependent Fis family transcriptional regulator [Pseudomonas fluorescens]